MRVPPLVPSLAGTQMVTAVNVYGKAVGALQTDKFREGWGGAGRGGGGRGRGTEGGRQLCSFFSPVTQSPDSPYVPGSLHPSPPPPLVHMRVGEQRAGSLPPPDGRAGPCFCRGAGAGLGANPTARSGSGRYNSRCVLGHSWNRHEGPLSRPCVRIPGKMLGRC